MALVLDTRPRSDTRDIICGGWYETDTIPTACPNAAIIQAREGLLDVRFVKPASFDFCRNEMTYTRAREDQRDPIVCLCVPAACDSGHRSKRNQVCLGSTTNMILESSRISMSKGVKPLIRWFHLSKDWDWHRRWTSQEISGVACVWVRTYTLAQVL